MKVKVFTPNHSGKIEFTPAELEKLLNEIYEDGQRNCNCNKSITWTNPYTNITPCYSATCATNSDKDSTHPPGMRHKQGTIDKSNPDKAHRNDFYTQRNGSMFLEITYVFSKIRVRQQPVVQFLRTAQE